MINIINNFNAYKYRNIKNINVQSNSVSFGKYKKVGTAKIMERDTGFPVEAEIKQEKIGSFSSFKLMVKNKEAGYMDIDTNVECYEIDNGIYRNNIPVVEHIRTIMGDKYSGIGTALISIAINESIKAKQEGCLFVKSTKGFASECSEYRKNENAIPFYYKLGFVATDRAMDFRIKKALNSNNYDNLPDTVTLVLTPDAIKNRI